MPVLFQPVAGEPICISRLARFRALGRFGPGGGAPAFTMDLEPSNFNLSSGESQIVAGTLTLVSGSPANATLSTPELPAGWTADFNTNPVSTDGGTFNLTLTAP